jgi:AMP nucleosidase
MTTEPSKPVFDTPEPRPIAQFFTDAEAALDHVCAIYEFQVRHLTDRFQAFASGRSPEHRVRAFYPFVQVTTHTHARLDSRLAYGFVRAPGVYTRIPRLGEKGG